jgi:hypothetical protein
MKKSNVGGDVTLTEVKLNSINETIGRMTESPPGCVAALKLQFPSNKFQRKLQTSSAKLGAMHQGPAVWILK